MKIVELKPIRETTEEYEAIEKRIRKAFFKLLYVPILKKLLIPKTKIQNSRKDLIEAMNDGKITYSRGAFRGKFDASTSRELTAMGAKWDKKTGTFKIQMISLKPEIREAIRISEFRFSDKLAKIDKEIAAIAPAEIAGSIVVKDLFDKMIFKVEKQFEKTLENITVVPKITPIQRAKIATEWQDNMDLWIKNFAEEQIKTLRATVKESTFAGNRYESLVKGISDDYGVVTKKAKFLARQESHLLLAKYKEAKYTEAGVPEYKWGCVKMPHDQSPNQHTLGNVRYYHGKLEGTIHRWDDPPVTAENPERRNNPGQDWNCRCFSIPLARYEE